MPYFELGTPRCVQIIILSSFVLIPWNELCSKSQSVKDFLKMKHLPLFSSRFQIFTYLFLINIILPFVFAGLTKNDQTPSSERSRRQVFANQPKVYVDPQGEISISVKLNPAQLESLMRASDSITLPSLQSHSHLQSESDWKPILGKPKLDPIKIEVDNHNSALKPVSNPFSEVDKLIQVASASKYLELHLEKTKQVAQQSTGYQQQKQQPVQPNTQQLPHIQPQQLSNIQQQYQLNMQQYQPNTQQSQQNVQQYQPNLQQIQMPNFQQQNFAQGQQHFLQQNLQQMQSLPVAFQPPKIQDGYSNNGQGNVQQIPVVQTLPVAFQPPKPEQSYSQPEQNVQLGNFQQQNTPMQVVPVSFQPPPTSYQMINNNHIGGGGPGPGKRRPQGHGHMSSSSNVNHRVKAPPNGKGRGGESRNKKKNRGPHSCSGKILSPVKVINIKTAAGHICPLKFVARENCGGNAPLIAIDQKLPHACRSLNKVLRYFQNLSKIPSSFDGMINNLQRRYRKNFFAMRNAVTKKVPSMLATRKSTG